MKGELIDRERLLEEGIKTKDHIGDKTFRLRQEDLAEIDALVEDMHMQLRVGNCEDTIEHMQRERGLANLIGHTLALGDSNFPLPESKLYELDIAAALHDVGKLRIPRDILNKEGALNSTERARMEKHVHHSLNMIEEAPRYTALSDRARVMVDQAIKAIRFHHLSYDGKGYAPGKQAGHQPTYFKFVVPFTAYIMQAADMIDACTRRRCYHHIAEKPLRTPKEAQWEIMQLKGKQFNPIVADAVAKIQFANMFSLYAQLKDDKYVAIIKTTMRSAIAKGTIPSMKGLEELFRQPSTTKHGAPYQIGMATPAYEGGKQVFYCLERDRKMHALGQERKYGIEVLADGHHLRTVAELAVQVAHIEGYPKHDLNRIATVFDSVIPAHLAHARQEAGEGAPINVGNAYALEFDEQARSLNVLMRNKAFGYERQETLMRELQNHLDVVNGGSTSRLIAKSSRDKVVQISIPISDVA